MNLHTASEVLSLTRVIEDNAAEMYRRLAQAASETELWLKYAKENSQNVKNVERAYYNVISDALDGTFAFNIDDAPFASLTEPSGSCTLQQALATETKTTDLYAIASEQSSALLPDVSRAMKSVHQKHQARVATLESMLASRA